MDKILYFECFSGISGDMAVAALIDLGVDQQYLLEQLGTLSVEGYRVEITRKKKSGLDVCDFAVILEEKHQEFPHDHHHAGGHFDHAEHHLHDHRNLADIQKIIAASGISEGAKKRTLAIFSVLAEAEGKVHGLPLDQVHFHEVGAVDSIVDIAAFAICLDYLKIDKILFSPLWEGQGQISCRHGVLPVPVPAVSEILKQYNIPTRITDRQAELVTPTGAAFAAAVGNMKKLPDTFVIEKTGTGTGKREYQYPSFLRAMILKKEEESEEQLWMLETNIDDCTGENLAYVMNQLLEIGMPDVFYTPIYMKKGRPAYKLSVLCPAERIGKAEDCIFRQTTTIGIRKFPVTRSILTRRQETVTTKWGTAGVKVCSHGDHWYCYPEYESVRAICDGSQEPFDYIYREIIRIWESEQ